MCVPGLGTLSPRTWAVLRLHPAFAISSHSRRIHPQRQDERRRYRLQRLVKEVATGEKVETLRMEKALVYTSKWPSDRRPGCVGILQE